jgi:type I restriction enzyme S subunit
MKDRTNKKIRLMDLCLSKPQYGLNEAAVDDMALPKYLRITDINDNGNFVYQGAHVQCNDSEYKLKLNDIVFARTGASVGKSYLYKETDGELAFAGFLIKFSIDPKKADSRFVSYCCETKEYWKWVNINCARSGQPGINAEEYSSLSLPYFNFTLKKQNKIAKILTKWDEAIELQENLIEKLEKQKKGLMQKLLTPRKGWRVESLQNVVTKQKAKIVQINNKGKYPIVDMEYYLNKKYINYTNDDGIFVNEDDVVLLWDGAGAGTPILGAKGVICSTFVKLVPSSILNAGFLYYFLCLIREKNNSLREGSGVPHIPKDFLKTQRIYLPIIDEQISIYESLFCMDKIIIFHIQKLTLLKRQRKSLMQLLLTGTVPVKI